jgi:hypothetical protein
MHVDFVDVFAKRETMQNQDVFRSRAIHTETERAEDSPEDGAHERQSPGRRYRLANPAQSAGVRNCSLSHEALDTPEREIRNFLPDELRRLSAEILL